MKGMSKFQLVLTGVFGALILIGVLVFAFAGRGSNNVVSNAVVWGTMSSSLFDNVMKGSGLSQDKTISVTYVEKNKETFDQDFIEALAVGRGPDLFFLPQDSILKHQDKIFTIPFESYPERTFKDTFVQEGELYLSSDGILALPFIIDPLVMYWNRDMFSNAGLSLTPRYWSELYDLTTRLTVKDTNFNITKSAVALGEHANISNANEILSLLIMQAGSRITERDANGALSNLLNQRLNYPIPPAQTALNFFIEFSNPLKPFYSWNRSIPTSKSFFLSGDLALYFGFASELADIRLKNPNLNFDVTSIPQSKSSNLNMTYGRMIGLAIPKNSKNIASAFKVANSLTSATTISTLVNVLHLPPVRRDLLATRPAQTHMSLFYDAAIQARGWLSPEPANLNPIFKEMVESVTAGRSNSSEALVRASQQLDSILK